MLGGDSIGGEEGGLKCGFLAEILRWSCNTKQTKLHLLQSCDLWPIKKKKKKNNNNNIHLLTLILHTFRLPRKISPSPSRLSCTSHSSSVCRPSERLDSGHPPRRSNRRPRCQTRCFWPGKIAGCLTKDLEIWIFLKQIMYIYI